MTRRNHHEEGLGPQTLWWIGPLLTGGLVAVWGRPMRGKSWLTAAALDAAGIGSNSRVLHSRIIHRRLFQNNYFVCCCHGKA